MLLHTFLYFSGPLKGCHPLFPHSPTTCNRLTAPRSSGQLTHYSPLHNSLYFTSPPIVALFSPNSTVRYSHQSNPFISYETSQPLHLTRYTLFILQSVSRWRPANNSMLLTSTNIAQHYIPTYTAAPTFPILFSKNPIFKNIFGPFPRAPGAFAPHFPIPLLPLHIPKFSPNF